MKKERNIKAHRIWMIRNYATAYSAVFLRLFFLINLIPGRTFHDNFPIVCWTCYIPCIIISEAYLK